MMTKRLRDVVIVFVALVLTGAVMRPLEQPVWEAQQAQQPSLRLASLEGAMGQGITLGMLGGFRALVANALWLSASASWERDDLPQTQTRLQLVTVVDPRPLFFWLNASRMIALDMPVWRIKAAGGWDAVPETVQQSIQREQALVALELLDAGLAHHPNHPSLLLEIGNIHQRRMDDLETAAEYYLKASRQPGAPYYAARIHAEFLRRLGRPREAYEFLLKLLPTLPTDDFAAMPWVVHDRIRELEDELGIPLLERSRAVRPQPVQPPQLFPNTPAPSVTPGTVDAP